MQIFVNNQKLDAQLAGEKTVAEVYEAVSRWSADNRKYILSLRVDDNDVSLETLKEMPTEDVDRLDFFIGDEMEMVLTTLSELDRYVDQIGGILFEQTALSGEDIVHLCEGVHWIQEIMKSVAGILNLDFTSISVPANHPGTEGDGSIQECLHRLTARAEGFTHLSGREEIELFLEDLRSLKSYSMSLLLQIRAIHAGREELIEILEDFETGLPTLLEDIVEINRGFNTGTDAASLESLESLTGRLEGFMAALTALDYQLRRNDGEGILGIDLEGIPFSTRVDSLTALLKDLSSALEESDVVAVGDVLEYELTDQLRGIAPYLSRIRLLAVQ